MEFLQIYGEGKALRNLLTNCDSDRRLGVRGGAGGQACLIGSTIVDVIYQAGRFRKLDAAVAESGGNYLQYLLSGMPERAVEIFRHILPDRNFFDFGPLLRLSPEGIVNYPVLEKAVHEVPVNIEKVRATGVDFRVVTTKVQTGQPRFLGVDDVSDIREAGLASGFAPLFTGGLGYPLDGQLYMDAVLGQSKSLDYMAKEMGITDLVFISSLPMNLQSNRIPGFFLRYLQDRFPQYGEAFYEGLARQHEWFNGELPYWAGEKTYPGIRIDTIAPTKKRLEMWDTNNRKLGQVESLTSSSIRRLIADLC